MVESPCVEVCRMDPSRELCAGCWRTLDEIARWRDMSDAERGALVAQLAHRRAAAELPEKA